MTGIEDPDGGFVTEVVNVDNPNLDNFNIEAIDLYETDAILTLTVEQLEALSELSDSLLIKGDSGDTVTLGDGLQSNGAEATKSSETKTVGEGENKVVYDIYLMGDEGVIAIEQGVNVII